jgi:hypothetical protein
VSCGYEIWKQTLRKTRLQAIKICELQPNWELQKVCINRIIILLSYSDYCTCILLRFLLYHSLFHPSDTANELLDFTVSWKSRGVWFKVLSSVHRWRGCVSTRRLFCRSTTTSSPRIPEFHCHTTTTALGTCTSRTCKRRTGGGTCARLTQTPCVAARATCRLSVSNNTQCLISYLRRPLCRNQMECRTISTGPHRCKSRKTVIFILIAVKTWNLTTDNFVLTLYKF